MTCGLASMRLSTSKPLSRSLIEGTIHSGRSPVQDSQSGDKEHQGWLVCDAKGDVLGALSADGDRKLAERGLGPDQFEFRNGEVRVGRIYRHLKFNDITGEKIEDWFVVLPQIRVCSVNAGPGGQNTIAENTYAAFGCDERVAREPKVAYARNLLPWRGDSNGKWWPRAWCRGARLLRSIPDHLNPR